METVSKLMGTDKGPACAAPDDFKENSVDTPLVEEHIIGTPLVSPRSHKSTLDDRCMALRIRVKDSVIEEKKKAEACAPHACMHFDSLTQCMARPGFAEAFADMICHTQCPKDVALTNLTHRPANEKTPVATSITKGSSSEGSCTDEGSGDDTEPNPMDLVYDVVEALTPDKDAWADINRVIEKFEDSEFCMEMIEDMVALNMFLINATRTKAKIKFRED